MTKQAASFSKKTHKHIRQTLKGFALDVTFPNEQKVTFNLDSDRITQMGSQDRTALVMVALSRMITEINKQRNITDALTPENMINRCEYLLNAGYQAFVDAPNKDKNKNSDRQALLEVIQLERVSRERVEAKYEDLASKYEQLLAKMEKVA